MLDIHPPHHAASTWRDFFIHIATIVIGLCIAVGIEQTVEYIHHRRELRTAREELHEELTRNRRGAARQMECSRPAAATTATSLAATTTRASGSPSCRSLG